jgi:hypothetical protein
VEAVEHLRREPVDHGVAEELQALVVADAVLGMLVDEGAVGDGLQEQAPVAESQVQPALQAGQLGPLGRFGQEVMPSFSWT